MLILADPQALLIMIFSFAVLAPAVAGDAAAASGAASFFGNDRRIIGAI